MTGGIHGEKRKTRSAAATAAGDQQEGLSRLRAGREGPGGRFAAGDRGQESAESRGRSGGAKIAPYAFGTGHNHEPDRKRKLLLHRSQIRKIIGKLQQRGFTLVPLRIYFNERGLAKVELALATGKRQYDKRAKLQKEQQRKDTDRAMKKYRK
jgi:hypothetical protein